MQTRQLGKNGPLISALGLGCMGMSDFYDPHNRNDAESIAVIHAYLDAGANFLDTADIYGNGQNESLIAKAISSRRPSVFLATKFANQRDANNQFLPPRGDPAYVKQACDASLKRLNTDHIDLYYQHRVDPNTPIEDTVSAMADLVKAGKVRCLGLSEASAKTIRRAHAIHPIAALQTEYSLWSREPELDLFPTTRDLGIAFVPYSPLGRGFLAGQFKSEADLAPNDSRRNMPRFQGDNFQKNLDLVTKIKSLAAAKNITPSQLALAWVLAQGPDFIPIPGTKRLPYLKENLAALNITLTQEDLAEITSALPPNCATGDRYHLPGMKTINR